MRNSDDLPQPLGPTIRRWRPGLTEKFNFSTRTSPLGETMGTSMNSMSVLSIVVPRVERMDACSAEEVEAEETSFFSNLPAWISSITFSRVATREV